MVRVLGANFGAGAHYMCRFDGITVDASYDVANSTIHCTSVPRATARAAPLEVSLNSQQYTATGANFTWYMPPTIRLVTPDAGPVGGNTTVRLYGEGLDAGLDYYRCRFGASVVPASVHIEGGQPTLLCVSPAHLAEQVALEVALNSRQYTNGSYPFVFYEPPTVVNRRRRRASSYQVELHGARRKPLARRARRGPAHGSALPGGEFRTRSAGSAGRG